MRGVKESPYGDFWTVLKRGILKDGEYDFPYPGFSSLFRALAAQVWLKDCKHALELGSGDGLLTTILSSTVPNVTVVDNDPDLLANAAVPGVFSKICDLDNADNISDFFLSLSAVDGVSCMELLEHLDARSHAPILSEIQCLLPSRAPVIISTPNRDVCERFDVTTPGHKSEMSLEESKALVTEYFEIMETFAEGAYPEDPDPFDAINAIYRLYDNVNQSRYLPESCVTVVYLCRTR